MTPRARLLTACLGGLLAAGCSEWSSAPPDALPSDDDDSTSVEEPWVGRYVPFPAQGGIGVTLGEETTTTDADGWWELPAPTDLPAQLDVAVSDDYADSQILCAPNERILNGWGSAETADVALRAAGWSGQGDVGFLVIQTTPDGLRRRNSTTGGVGTGTPTTHMGVRLDTRWWVEVRTIEDGRLTQYVLEEQTPLTSTEDTEVTLDLTTPPSTWTWSGSVEAEATEVKVVQRLPLDENYWEAVTLWEGPPPAASVELPILGDIPLGSIQFEADLPPVEGCSGPSYATRWTEVEPGDLVAAIPAPPEVPRAFGPWAPRPTIELELPDDSLGMGMLIAPLFLVSSWTLYADEGCLPERIRWPANLADIEAGTPLNLAFGVDLGEGASASCNHWIEDPSDDTR